MLLKDFSPFETDKIKRSFNENYVVKIERALSDNLRPFFQQVVSNPKNFDQTDWEGIGSDRTVSNPKIVMKVKAMIDSSSTQEQIKRLLGVQKITKTDFRMFILDSENQTGLGWHTDCTEVDRYAALKIELSLRPYQGGEFQYRDKKTEDMIFESEGLNFGDAYLFRTSFEKWEHRVLPVKGESERGTLIIWFYVE